MKGYDQIPIYRLGIQLVKLENNLVPFAESPRWNSVFVEFKV